MSYIPVDGDRHNVKIGVEYPTGSGIMYYDASTFEAIEPPTFPRILEAQQKIDKVIPALKDEELYLRNPFAPAAGPCRQPARTEDFQFDPAGRYNLNTPVQPPCRPYAGRRLHLFFDSSTQPWNLQCKSPRRLDRLAYLVALDAGFSYREYCIDAKGVTIGRDGSCCDIVVAGATVSRRHVRILLPARHRFFLEDLDSTNGVFVNGRKIIDSVALLDGDLIGLGSATTPHLRFQDHSSREIRHLTLAAKEQWVIGRTPDCDLSLPFEPTVSSRHASSPTETVRCTLSTTTASTAPG